MLKRIQAWLRPPVTIARKDWTWAKCNNLVLSTVIVVSLLSGFSLIAHFDFQKENNRQAKELQHLVEQQWDQQPARHPHRVAHFGHFAIRQLSPLSFIDNGVNPFVGNATFLEAHQLNSTNFSAAVDSPNTLRFGELTIGSIIQLFLPLFIFSLLFGQYRQERDGQLLRMHHVSGVSSFQFQVGKLVGNLLIVLTIIFPTWLVCLALMLRIEVIPTIWPRFWLLTLLYLVYLFVWSGFAVLVFTRLKNPRKAFATLLALWTLFFIIVPRLLPVAAETVYPAPTAAEFNRKLHRAVSASINAHNISDQRFIAEKERLLKRHGVERVEDLPFNFRGFGMSIGEESSTEIFRRQIAQLEARHIQQNRFIETFGIVNPLIAVRFLSQLLAGAGYHHAFDFDKQAEQHRYQFVQKLNELHMHEIAYENDRDQKLTSQFWQEFKDFQYDLPSLPWVSKRALYSSLALFVWVILTFVGLATFKVRVQ